MSQRNNTHSAGHHTLVKSLVIFYFLFSISYFCFAVEPVLHYDFTSPVIKAGGVYEAPKLPAGIRIADPPALVLTGEKNKYKITIPGGEKLTIINGGTLYALVKFEDDGVKGGENNAHDMIFFKSNEFLLGRAWGGIYFNGGGEKLEMHTQTKTVPVKKWTAIAASISKIKSGYVVRLYIDGKIAAAKWFPIKVTTTGKPVTIGEGWGGPWYMNGQIGRLMFFDKDLTEKEIAELTAKEVYLKAK